MINIKNIPKEYRICYNCTHCIEKQYDCDYYEYYCEEYNYHVNEEDDGCHKWKFNEWQLCTKDGTVLWAIWM